MVFSSNNEIILHQKDVKMHGSPGGYMQNFIFWKGRKASSNFLRVFSDFFSFRSLRNQHLVNCCWWEPNYTVTMSSTRRTSWVFFSITYEFQNKIHKFFYITTYDQINKIQSLSWDQINIERQYRHPVCWVDLILEAAATANIVNHRKNMLQNEPCQS